MKGLVYSNDNFPFLQMMFNLSCIFLYCKKIRNKNVRMTLKTHLSFKKIPYFNLIAKVPFDRKAYGLRPKRRMILIEIIKESKKQQPKTTGNFK